MCDDYEDDFHEEEEGKGGERDGWRVITFDELELDSKPLGGGGFALVYRGTWRGKSVAIKTLVRRAAVAAPRFRVRVALRALSRYCGGCSRDVFAGAVACSSTPRSTTSRSRSIWTSYM
jgi:hypothetical protein